MPYSRNNLRDLGAQELKCLCVDDWQHSSQLISLKVGAARLDFSVFKTDKCQMNTVLIGDKSQLFAVFYIFYLCEQGHNRGIPLRIQVNSRHTARH